MATETLFESILRLFSLRTTSLQHLLRLLPEIKVNPLPEDIFLATIKPLVVPAASLSLPQWATLGLLILLTNTSPTLRKATLKLYGYLSLIIGAEIAMINAYVLVGTPLIPLVLVNSFRIGLLVHLPVDYTPTCDCSHIEPLEQPRPCPHGFSRSHPPYQGKYVLLGLNGQPYLHDGHTNTSQVHAACQCSDVHPSEPRVHSHFACRRERRRHSQHQYPREVTQLERLHVVRSSSCRQPVSNLHHVSRIFVDFHLLAATPSVYTGCI